MRSRWMTAAAVGAAGVGAGYLAYRRLVRPWQQHWGATAAEVAAALPGDELVAPPVAQCTRAISIAAAPEQVWPWLVQLGADRGGFYSYDWAENLVGLGIHSADEVVAQWQDTAVGDLVLATRKGTAGWYVAQLDPGRALVLEVANLAAGRPLRRDEAMRWEFSWSFVLRPGPDGTTRLLVRERTAFGSPLARAALAPVGLISFVMSQRMMRGIRDRAETGWPGAGSNRRPSDFQSDARTN